MKIIDLDGHIVEIYDSIDELPIVRFHAFNKMLLIDAGIGSDLADFDSHIERVTRFLMAKDNDNAIKELANMRQNVYMIQQGVSPKHMAFAALVKSIDGEPCPYASVNDLETTRHKLDACTKKKVAAETEATKKKIEEEFRVYFPALSDDAEVKEYYDTLRKRTLLLLDIIENGETEEKRQEVEELTTRLVTSDKPRSFEGKNSAEVAHDKSFEDMCLVIAKELHADAKKMTVLEYYNAFEFVKTMQKQQKKQK
jgi:hypothetical protein